MFIYLIFLLICTEMMETESNMGEVDQNRKFISFLSSKSAKG